MAFVQEFAGTTLSGSTLSATNTVTAMTAGNMAIVTIQWTGTGITPGTPTDTALNAYGVVSGRSNDANSTLHMASFFCPKIAAAAISGNTVSTVFAGGTPTNVSIVVTEVAAFGQDVQVALVSAATTGSGTSVASPSISPSFPYSFIYSAFASLNVPGTVTAGSGYTLRVTSGRLSTEDKSVGTVASTTATATLSVGSGAWVIQVIAFRADSPSRDLTPIGAPTDYVQVTWGGPSGGGNHDILFWYDNVYLANGTTSTSTNSYDSFNSNDAGTRTTDWYGYTFPISLVFSGIAFQQGGEFSDGGWFTSTPNIQVLVGSTWTTVSGAVWSPSYQGQNGINFFPYQATFTPMAGTGIRIQGVPGGLNTFTSIRQLRCYGPTLYQDATAQGTATSFVQTTWGGPTGAGGPISVMSDNVWPAANTTPTGSNEYDTLNSNDAGTRITDWWGYTFGSSQSFVAVAVEQGGQFADGGWFVTTLPTPPNVQTLIAGVWTNVAGATWTPAYAGHNNVSFFRYVATFPAVSGTGIRIQGVPGGSNTFTSVGELRAYLPSTPLSNAPQDPIGFGAEA